MRHQRTSTHAMQAFSLTAVLHNVRTAAFEYFTAKSISLPRVDTPDSAALWQELVDVLDILLAKGDIPVAKDVILQSSKEYLPATPLNHLPVRPALVAKLGAQHECRDIDGDGMQARTALRRASSPSILPAN